MTPAQLRSFYFPAWRRCAEARGWIMRDGRLTSDLSEPPSLPDLHRDLHSKIVACAHGLAAQAHRAVTAEDLRHACNISATGRPSSAHLTNSQVNRVVTLFKLFTAPEDLQAVMDWLHPENAARRSFIAFIEACADEALIRHISSNAFQTRHWQGLDLPKLRWLAGQLKNRSKHGGAPARPSFSEGGRLRRAEHQKGQHAAIV